MASEVEWRLVANNEQYINAIREAQRANRDLYDSSAREQRREKGLIEDISEEIRRLEESKKKAWTTEDIEKHNKKIEEAKRDLNEYEQAGRKNVKTTEDQAKAGNKMVSTLKSWAIGLASVAAALKVFRTIINSTKATADAMAESKAALTARIDVLARSIATLNFTDLGRRMNRAADAAREYASVMALLGDRKRSLEVVEAGYTAKLAQLRADMRDTTLTYQEQEAALSEYMNIRKDIAAQTIDIANVELEALAKRVAAAVDLQGEELQSFIENFNEKLPLMEQAQRFQKQMNKEEIRMRMEHRRELLKDTKLTQIESTAIAGGGITTRTILTREGEDELNRIVKERLVERKQLYISGNAALKELSQEQVDDYLELVRKYGEGKDEEYDIVAAAMIAQRQANAMMAQDEQELVRVRNRIDNQKAAERRQYEADEKSKREAFFKSLFELEEQAELQRIENLKGLERLIAEEEYNIAQIDKLEAHLESLGDLEEHHYQMLEDMRDEVRNTTLDQQVAWYEEQKEEEAAHNSEMFRLNRELQESALELMEDNEIAKLELKVKFYEEDKKLLLEAGDEISLIQAQIIDNQIAVINRKIEESKKEADPARTILGMNDEQLGALKTAAREFQGVMNDILEARVRDAERNRQLADTRISELQRELDRETALMRDGFANNLDAKREELEQMQQIREEALRREEAALKAQRIADSVAQTSNLITASSDIFKQFSKIPVIGIPLAIAMIGTMFGAFAAAKAKAKESTKLAKGGTGVVTGRLHSEGGEPFGDHIEVERGERWGVLSRSASQKYGKVFEQMVNSFNKGKMPLSGVPVLSGESEKTVGELVEIKDEMKSLNKHFKGKSVEYSGGVRIERAKNRVRIIRRNV